MFSVRVYLGLGLGLSGKGLGQGEDGIWSVRWFMIDFDVDDLNVCIVCWHCLEGQPRLE